MAYCAHTDSTTGSLIPDTTPIAQCTAYVVLDSSDYANQQINPGDILYVYSWGMGAVLLMWSLGFAVGAAKNSVKKV